MPDLIILMCWEEFTTRVFHCHATPGVVQVVGAGNTVSASSRDRYTCVPMQRALERYANYQAEQTSQNLPQLPINQWAAQTRTRYCTNTQTYMATWRTQRSCVTGLNGLATCRRANSPHTYPRAPGGEAPQPGFLLVRLFSHPR
jgi:hypothetical protein